MNIKKELIEIKSGEDFGASLYENLKVQQEEIKKKIHIVNIVSAVAEIENLIANDFFDKGEVKFLEVMTGTDYREIKSINFDGLDETKDFAGNPDSDYYQNLFSRIFKVEELNLSLTNIDFATDENHVFELETGIGEKLLNLFLSPELKQVYEYNNMQIELPDNKEANKRLKI